MNTSLSKQEIVSVAMEIMIKFFLVGTILYFSFMILKPFIVLVLWAIIIAVALYPLVCNIEKKYKIKRSLILSVITIGAITALVVPTYMLSNSAYHSSQSFVAQVKDGTLEIPAPSEKIKTWPIVGKKLYTFADTVSKNMEGTLLKYQKEIKTVVAKVASVAGSAIGTVLQFIISLLIAAMFLSKSEGSIAVYQAISKRLIGQKGVEWANLSALTVRSVVQGVIGIALIQASLALAGLVIMDIPFAGFWALIVMFLAIIQLPPTIIILPIIIYVFSYADTTSATIFAIYMMVVSVSDTFLKPVLLGRGVDIPMLVILLGAIGGMILFGILGLFVGAVILALAYKLFMTWLEQE